MADAAEYEHPENVPLPETDQYIPEPSCLDEYDTEDTDPAVYYAHRAANEAHKVRKQADTNRKLAKLAGGAIVALLAASKAGELWDRMTGGGRL